MTETDEAKWRREQHPKNWESYEPFSVKDAQETWGDIFYEALPAEDLPQSDSDS